MGEGGARVKRAFLFLNIESEAALCFFAAMGKKWRRILKCALLLIN